MKAARPPRCYEASWLPVSASELILSSGSKTFSPASPIIPLPGLPSFCRITGRPLGLDPKLRTAPDTLRHSLVLVIVGRLRYSSKSLAARPNQTLTVQLHLGINSALVRELSTLLPGLDIFDHCKESSGFGPSGNQTTASIKFGRTVDGD